MSEENMLSWLRAKLKRVEKVPDGYVDLLDEKDFSSWDKPTSTEVGAWAYLEPRLVEMLRLTTAGPRRVCVPEWLLRVYTLAPGQWCHNGRYEPVEIRNPLTGEVTVLNQIHTRWLALAMRNGEFREQVLAVLRLSGARAIRPLVPKKRPTGVMVTP